MSESFRISNISIAISVNRTIIEWGEGRSGGWRDYAVATGKRRIKCQDIKLQKVIIVIFRLEVCIKLNEIKSQLMIMKNK